MRLNNYASDNKPPVSGVGLSNYLRQAQAAVKDKGNIRYKMFPHNSGINNSLPKINTFAYSATGAAKHHLSMNQTNETPHN
jgi:hypothetical protein